MCAGWSAASRNPAAPHRLKMSQRTSDGARLLVRSGGGDRETRRRSIGDPSWTEGLSLIRSLRERQPRADAAMIINMRIKTQEPSATAEPWFSLANLLSLSRIPLAAALWIAPTRTSVVLGLVLLAALTDALDGWVARYGRAHRAPPSVPIAKTEERGAWLDPLCDKIFILSLIGVLFVTLRPGLLIMLLLGARELVLVPLLLLYRFFTLRKGPLGIRFRAGWFGKATTVAQFVSLCSLLVGSRHVLPLAVLTAGLGIAAVIEYLIRGLRALYDARTRLVTEQTLAEPIRTLGNNAPRQAHYSEVQVPR